MGTLPRANWPAASGYYKVVQLYIGNEPHFCFSEKDMEYHWEILSSVLRQLGIACQTVQGYLSRRQIPTPAGAGYRCPGMGRVMIEIEGNQKHAGFYGNSGDYDMTIDPDHVERMKLLFPEWDIECMPE